MKKIILILTFFSFNQMKINEIIEVMEIPHQILKINKMAFKKTIENKISEIINSQRFKEKLNNLNDNYSNLKQESIKQEWIYQ